jgi:hypothetical protein
VLEKRGTTGIEMSKRPLTAAGSHQKKPLQTRQT